MNQMASIPVIQKFTLSAALACRDGQAFARWLDGFLRGPGVNVPLADGLLKQERWWIKPEQRQLGALAYKCGPGREYHEDEEAWNRRIEDLAREIQGGLAVVPLIAEFNQGQLLLADGNHRCGALQHLGVASYWTAIWFNSNEEYSRFLSVDRATSS